MQDFKVESPWGAIAAFILLQCFGAISFNAMIFHLGPGFPAQPGEAAGPLFLRVFGKVFLSFWGLGWLLVFVLFDYVTASLILQFFHTHCIAALLNVAHPLTSIKVLLTLIFGRMLFILHHNYPFPKPRGHQFMPLFLLASLAISLGMTSRDAGSNMQSGSEEGCIIGFLFGMVFFACGCAEPRLFYLAGLLGGGLATMMMCAMLLNNDEWSLEGAFLTMLALILLFWSPGRSTPVTEALT